MKTIWTLLISAALTAPSVACEDDDDRRNIDGDGDTTVQGLTNNEVLGVLRVADSGEIQQADVARTRASAPLVTAYAERMLAEHQHSERIASAMTEGLDIAPAESDHSRALQQQSSAALANLMNLSAGPSFDRTYLDAQIAAHQQLLRLIDMSAVCDTNTTEIIGDTALGEGDDRFDGTPPQDFDTGRETDGLHVGEGSAFTGFTSGAGCIGIGGVNLAGGDFGSGTFNSATLPTGDTRLRDLLIVQRASVASHLTEAILLRSRLSFETPQTP